MAKAGRPKKPEGKGRSVRIEEEIVNKARIVAFRSGKPISDYLASILRGPVDRDYRKTINGLTEKENQKAGS